MRTRTVTEGVRQYAKAFGVRGRTRGKKDRTARKLLKGGAAMEDNDSRPAADSTSADGDESYEFEQILDHRVARHDGKSVNEYLVKWKGYPIEESTWEPTNHFKSQSIEDFYQNRIDNLRTLLKRLL